MLHQQTTIPRTKDQALDFLKHESQDVRIAGAWYFNDFPELLEEDAVEGGLLCLLKDDAKSSTPLVVSVCEVLAQSPAYQSVVVPHIVALLEGSDPEVVRSVSYSACIAVCAQVRERISAILSEPAYPYPACRQALAEELIRLSGSTKSGIRRPATALLQQQQGDAAALIADVRSNGL